MDTGVVASPTSLGRAAEADADGRPSPAARPRDLRVRRGPFRSKLVLTGALDAVDKRRVLVPRTPEYQIEIRWLIDDGARVEAGDRLVELDTASIASQLSDKQIAVEAAKNELASKIADVDGKLAERELAVQTAGIALRKAEIEADVPAEMQSRREFEQSRLALQQARVAYDKAVADLEGYRRSSDAELEVLRIDLRTAEREVTEAERAIETMVLRAPRDGIVVVGENFREDRKFEVGDTAWSGAEVVSIPDLSAMMIAAVLSDVDDGKIKPGMRATCALDAYPDDPVQGRIVAISPVAHAAGSRSEQRHFSVEIHLEQTDPERMLPGMSARVEVETARRDDAVLVPREALVFGAGGVRVLLAGAGDEEVVLGPCNAFDCVVERGPEPGTPLRRR